MSFVTDTLGSLVGIKPHSQRVGEKMDALSESQMNEAKGYRENAAGGYGKIGQQGQNLYGQFTANMPGLLGQYKNATGLDTNIDQNRMNNPYALTPAQQTLLNGHIDTINKSMNTAIQNLRKSFADRGIDDPRAMAAQEAIVRSHYNDLSTQHSANFAEQARAQKEAALENLMRYFQGLGSMGMGAQESSAGGYGNLSSGALGASSQANSIANQKQQQQNALWGDLLGLGTFALGGGFARPAASTGGNQELLFGGMGETPYTPTESDMFTQPIGNPWATESLSPAFNPNYWGY